MELISSVGFYSPYKWITDYKENSAWDAYLKSTNRRYFSPGTASECFVVRYWGYKGLYNEVLYINSQYAYASIYDAMRQVAAYKQDECEGMIEILTYNDSFGFNVIRSWIFEVDGFQNMDGDYEIEHSGWVKA